MEEVTPLYLATQHEQEDAVTALLREASVDPNACSLPRGLTPLHMAAFLGSASVVARLLQRPDVRLQTCSAGGLNALKIALARQDKAIVLLLVEGMLRRTRARRVTPGLVKWHYAYVLVAWHHFHVAEHAYYARCMALLQRMTPRLA